MGTGRSAFRSIFSEDEPICRRSVYRADLEAVSVKGANTRKWIGCFLLFYYREAFAAVFFLFPAGFFSDTVKSGMAGFPLPYFWSGMRIASTGFFPEAKAL